MKKELLVFTSMAIMLTGCSKSSEPAVTSTEPYLLIPTTTEPITSTSIPTDSEYVNPQYVEPVVVDSFCMETDLLDEWGNVAYEEHENIKVRMLVWSNGRITAASFFDPISVGGYPRYDGSDSTDGGFQIQGKFVIKCLPGSP